MQEKEIEFYLKTQVEKQGGLCWKFTSPGTKGVPDRLVITPRRVIFVELKAPGGHTKPLQDVRIKQLQQLNQKVFVLDSKEAIDAFMKGDFRK